MTNKPNAHRQRKPRIGKDIPKTRRSTREKVTAVALPRDESTEQEMTGLEPAPEWSVENVASEAAAVNYTPAVSETPIIPVRCVPSGGVESRIVSALVSLARFAYRKPGTALAAAAAAGIACGFCVRRI